MPSQNARVNLTLPPEVIRVLDRMGKVTGAGRATIVREWLIEMVPTLGQFADALEAASGKNIDAFKIMASAVREVQGTADQLQLEIARDRRRAMWKKVR